ncbi:1-aminocyclopropane-1-carboxylate synthase 11 [Arthroderma uncinatum]|uniref:1-aminocyclopropane-1-carboxylate synthase 11 n=1 Tax=Arthroderma uncinatum TaxID=74035 RepID=UPI00144A8E09|nr:1-aminocyclopropane-1-carboxylate synthase 11 [Arthroderma uncinatum]KAF3483073.1 1-aminocyclopropane-1-carboxylate synthase 11 [Arthroderma uncinatum]
MLSTRGKKLTGMLDEPWRFPLSRVAMFNATSNPSGLISFGTAENSLVYDELTAYVNRNVQFDKSVWSYGYSSVGGKEFPAAMAGHINKYFDPIVPVKGSDILATNSVPTLSELLAFTLADAGDAILLSRPVYGRFEIDWGNRPGLKTIYADTEAVESFTPAVARKYEEALVAAEARGVKIRVLIIVNPHNPLGRCYPRETLIEIFKFCQKHQIHLVSDEIYALSVFNSGESGTVPFTSTLSIDPTGLIDEKLLHVIYGMSKDFSAPGLRIGCLISKNPQVQKAVRSTSALESDWQPATASQRGSFARTTFPICQERE